MDNISDIQAYYDASVDNEHSRLDYHQLERDITRRYFREYLPDQADILEIGAATGAYTLWLAREGHHITAVDLSGASLEKCEAQVAEAKLGSKVDCYAADARDLSSLPPKLYDAVLLMGPLYHLIMEEDRLIALRQAHSRLKPGGLIFSAFISRYGIMGHLLRKVSHWIESQEEVRSIIEYGHDPDHLPGERFRGYFATIEEIGPLHEQAGFEQVVLAGVEPAISADDESYNRLEGAQKELWLDLLYEVSSVPSMVASSRHLLYIGRKTN